MNYAKIIYNDIANGPGVRTSLFVSGCRNHCKGCFQPETWDFNYGNKFTGQTIQTILDSLAPKHISGLTLLGGDPLEDENIVHLYLLVCYIKHFYPHKDIWCFTGYIFEDIILNQVKRMFLSKIDVLVDGPFEENKKDLTLRFKGSSNQRIIDVNKTFENKNKIILWDS